MTKQATVADFSPCFAALEQKRQLIRTIMGGTDAMRAAGTKYLPQHPAEGKGVYDTRLQKTFLDNFVGLAIDKAVGKIFAKPVEAKDLTPELEAICANIDRQGSDLNTFAMDIAKTAFQDGLTYVLADKPAVKEGATVADEKAAGVRPYAVHLKPSCVLDIRCDMMGGVETITLLRWMETVCEPDGEWGMKEIPQVRVLRREGAAVTWETYRESETERGQWVLHESGPTAFKQIYLVPFYTNRCGFLRGAPGFQNVAESNLEHWQLKSEFTHALTMQCFGMLTATGVDEGDTIEVGPAKVLKSSNENAKFSYTEPTGEGIKLAAEALKAIESRIEFAGVNLRVENAGKVTATAAAIDSADTDSGLKAVAIGFSNVTKQLFSFFAEMMASEAGEASATFNTDFGQAHGTMQGVDAIDKGRARGDISREAWIDNLKWRGEMPPEFDAEADKERLDEEGPALGMVQTMQPKQGDKQQPPAAA